MNRLETTDFYSKYIHYLLFQVGNYVSVDISIKNIAE